MTEFGDDAIADPEWYCMGGFFVLVDGDQSIPVPFVAGDKQIKATRGLKALLLAILLH